MIGDETGGERIRFEKSGTSRSLHVPHSFSLTKRVVIRLTNNYYLYSFLSLILSFSSSLILSTYIYIWFSLSLLSSRQCFLSLIVALILCTWWLKSGNSSTRAFCQTDYGTSGVSLASHEYGQPCLSSCCFLSVSGCLF